MTRPWPACASAWCPAPTGRPATSPPTGTWPRAATWTPGLHLGDYIYEYGTGEYGTRGTVVRPHAPRTRSSPSPTTAPGTAVQDRPGPPGAARRGPGHRHLGRPRVRQRRLVGRRREPHRGRGGRLVRPPVGRQAGLLRVDAGAARDRGDHLPAAALRQAGRALAARPALLPLAAGEGRQRLGGRPEPYDHRPGPARLAEGGPEVLRHQLAAGRQLRHDRAVRPRLALRRAA